MIARLFSKLSIGYAQWIAKDIETGEEYKLTDRSLDDPKNMGYIKDLKEGEYVEYKIIKNYGYDPYDNQFPGIDYYDAAKIVKHLSVSEVRDLKINKVVK